MRIKQINPYDKYFKEFFERVMEFNEVIGNDVNDRTLIPLYTTLLIEEAGEMADATSAEEELDSALDQLVVGGFLSELHQRSLRVPRYELGCYVEGASSLIENIDNFPFVILEELMKTLTSLDIDLHGALHHVMDSNFSKIPVIGTQIGMDEDNFDRMCSDIESKGRYKGVIWGITNNRLIIRDENGKLLKADTFFEPELTQFINQGE